MANALFSACSTIYRSPHSHMHTQVNTHTHTHTHAHTHTANSHSRRFASESFHWAKPAEFRVAGYFQGVYIFCEFREMKNFREDCTHEVPTLGTWV